MICLVVFYSENTVHLPIKDRKLILQLLFELVFQSASLASFLRVIIVCLKLSENGTLEYAQLHSFITKLLKHASHMDMDPEILSYVSDYSHQCQEQICIAVRAYSNCL